MDFVSFETFTHQKAHLRKRKGKRKYRQNTYLEKGLYLEYMKNLIISQVTIREEITI